MKHIFFDHDGNLNINGVIVNHPSYKRILEDSVVTEAELNDQCKLVLSLFKRIEEECSDAQKELIKEMLVETNVLNAISRMYNLQLDFE
jgi:hypothetical protein